MLAGLELTSTAPFDEEEKTRVGRRARPTMLLQLVLLDSDAAAGVDASTCRRATVSAFAEDRLEAERASGPGVAAPHRDQHRAALRRTEGRDCLCPKAAAWGRRRRAAIWTSRPSPRRDSVPPVAAVVMSWRRTAGSAAKQVSDAVGQGQLLPATRSYHEHPPHPVSARLLARILLAPEPPGARVPRQAGA